MRPAVVVAAVVVVVVVLKVEVPAAVDFRS
jgi:hypothetical protein